MNELAETSQTVLQNDLWAAGIKTFATLCIVLGGLILVLYLLKRYFFKEKNDGHGPYIKMISSYHVTPKQRIALMDIVGEKWIVGISPEKMTCIGKVTDNDCLEQIQEEQGCENTGTAFQRFFVSSLKKEKNIVSGEKE